MQVVIIMKIAMKHEWMIMSIGTIIQYYNNIKTNRNSKYLTLITGYSIQNTHNSIKVPFAAPSASSSQLKHNQVTHILCSFPLTHCVSLSVKKSITMSQSTSCVCHMWWHYRQDKLRKLKGKGNEGGRRGKGGSRKRCQQEEEGAAETLRCLFLACTQFACSAYRCALLDCRFVVRVSVWVSEGFTVEEE